MIEFANKVLAAEADVFYLVFGLCCLSAVIMREIIGSGVVSFALIPITIACSLLVDYQARAYGIFLTGDPTIDVVAATGVGTIIGALCSFVCYRIGVSIADWRIQEIKRG